MLEKLKHLESYTMTNANNPKPKPMLWETTHPDMSKQDYALYTINKKLDTKNGIGTRWIAIIFSLIAGLSFAALLYFYSAKDGALLELKTANNTKSIEVNKQAQIKFEEKQSNVNETLLDKVITIDKDLGAIKEVAKERERRRKVRIRNEDNVY